jgi:hypothetical protein
MTAVRSDPERHKEQVRAANRARHRATKQLIDRHRLEWDALYEKEAAKEGVQPKPREGAEIATLRDQIANLTAQVQQLTETGVRAATGRTRGKRP